MGAALQQSEQGILRPIGFFSRAFNSAQTKYSTYDRELLAIYEAVRYFRVCLVVFI
ncbi:ribonuclease H family protein [Klebsiella pneumoniae]|uniref:ribonuclease H family protein n=1 Tax=Klebsiella pneumoniae TaxID=573 RepID=UPI0040555781